MIEIQSIAPRSNWERRVGSAGMAKEKWSEGQMAVILPSYLSEIESFVMDSCIHVISAVNGYFSKPAGPIADVPALSSTAMYNAMAKSWAKQEECLPIRLDLAVMKDGGLRLLAAKADELTGATQVLDASKSWFNHHYEGEMGVYEVNFLKENFSHLFEQYGTLSDRRTLFGATIVVDREDHDSEVTGRAVSQYFGHLCGIPLSEHGIENSSEMSLDKLISDEGGMYVTVKIPSWKNLLEWAGEGTFWPTAFESGNTGLNIMQPAWTYVVDNLLDAFDAKPEVDEVSKVLSVWTDIQGRFPISGMVASVYSKDYEFANATFYPAVVIAPTGE